MNPYLFISIIIAFAGSVAAAGFGGFRLGVDHEKAAQLDKQALVAEAVDAANAASAEAIAKLAPKHSTIRQVLEREVRENVVYRECKSSQAAVDAFNSGIDGVLNSDGKAASSNPAGGLTLPRANAAP